MKQWPENVMKHVIGTLLLVLSIVIFGQTIKSGALWYDVNGNRVTRLGVGMMKHKETYYLVGEKNNNSPTIFMDSSLDLVNREFLDEVVTRQSILIMTDKFHYPPYPQMLY